MQTAMPHTYDAIGRDYARHRRPDPRIQAAMDDALGPARTALSVGAGAGSYEPAQRRVGTVDPSLVMLRQQPSGAAGGVRAIAAKTPSIAPLSRALSRLALPLSSLDTKAPLPPFVQT